MLTNDAIEGYVGTGHYTLIFHDGHGGDISESVNIEVRNVLNVVDGPAGTQLDWTEDTPLGADASHPSGQDMSFSFTTDDPVTLDLAHTEFPAWLTAADITFDPVSGPDVNGLYTVSFTIHSTAAMPNNVDAQHGSDTLTIHFSDDNGSFTKTYTINVIERAPVFDSTAGYVSADNPNHTSGTDLDHLVMYEDRNGSSDPNYNTIDLHADDELQPSSGLTRPYYYLDTDAPAWLTMQDPFKGIINANPTNAEVQAGTYDFHVKCDDQNGGLTSQLVHLTVENRDPQFETTNAISDWSVDLTNWIIPTPNDGYQPVEDHAFSFDVTTDDELVGKTDANYSTTYALVNWADSPFAASDPSSHDATTTDLTVPTWLSFNTTTGVMSGNPKNSDVGVYYFAIKVDDGHGGVVYKPFKLDVVNVAPVFQTPNNQSGTDNDTGLKGGDPHDYDTPYVLTVTEDATPFTFDLLSSDEGQHDLTHTGTIVEYHLDSIAPLGIRFAADSSYAGTDVTQHANDPYPEDTTRVHGQYDTSISGKLVISVTNADVTENLASGGFEFSITVTDGNGGTDVIWFKIVVANATPQFEGSNALVWVEDTSSTAKVVNTDDTPYNRPDSDWGLISYTISAATPGDSGYVTDSAYTALDLNIFGIAESYAEATALGLKPGELYIKDAAYVDANGNPDNELVGRYQFLVTFNDGSESITHVYKLAVDEASTLITHLNTQVNGSGTDYVIPDHDPSADPANPNHPATEITIVQGDSLVLDPTAKDEYTTLDGANYTHEKGHYTLQVDWDNDGGIDETIGTVGGEILVPSVTTGYERTVEGDPSAPVVFHGGTITFDPKTGEIDWQPNNVDVTGSGDAHKFIITHYDDNGSADEHDVLVHVTNKDPVWTSPDAQPWYLTEDPSDWQSYGDAKIETDEEEQNLQYTLNVHYFDYETTHAFQDAVIDVDSTTALPASAPSTCHFEDGWRATQLHTEGEYILFNVYTGEILWKPNNADVTRAADSDPLTPGDKIDLNLYGLTERPDYEFTVSADDGHDGEALPEQIFTVTVDNAPTVITGSDLSGDDHVADPIPSTIFISEDQQVEVGTSLVVDVMASPQYGDGAGAHGDEDINLAGVIDAHYGLRVSANGGTDWLTIDPGTNPTDGEAINTDGAHIRFDKDTGQIYWNPNDLDVGTAGSASYLFEVTHYDGNGAEDSAQFTVTVNNAAPHFENMPGTGDDAAVLVEDSTNADDYTIAINTDDLDPEGYGVTCQVYFAVAGSAPDPSDLSAWQLVPVTGSTGLMPNGAGEITYDADAKTIIWHTTNADVNWKSGGGYEDGDQKYFFKVVATDTHVTDSLSRDLVFETKVQDVKPEIDHLDYTDQTGASQSEDIINEPITPALTIQEMEGTQFTLDFHSNDEQADSTDTNYVRDSYYEITVTYTDVGGTLHTHTFNETDTADWHYYTKTGTTEENSGDFTDFDPSTGLIKFTPNNRDVGLWTFDVTHHDSQGLIDTVQVQVNVNNDPPAWTAFDTTTWSLTEDTKGAAATHDQALIQADQEGEGLTYKLTVQYWNYTTNTWAYKYSDIATNFASYSDANHPASEHWVRGRINNEGGYLYFSLDTGGMNWDTNNADVTRYAQDDPVNPQGNLITGRHDYTFSVSAMDTHGGNLPAQSFQVTVDNVNTVLTGATGTGQAGNNHIADPVLNLSVIEDRDDSGNDALVQVYASPNYGGDSDQDLADNPAMDAHFGLRVSADGGTTWTTIDPGTNPGDGDPMNAGGANIRLNKDTGQIFWNPNDLDVGLTGSKIYTFEVTHYDGNGGEDSDQFNVTVNNAAPDFDPSMPSLATAKVLVEDSTTTADFTIPVLTDDLAPHGYGVTYTVYFGVADTKDDVTVWHTVYDSTAGISGYIPNLDLGGADFIGTISFNSTTNSIIWHTSNADVNWNGTYLNADQKYFFKVEATDTHTPGNQTSEYYFETKVQEVKPEIDSLVYTDQNGDAQHVDIDTTNEPPNPAIATIQEMEDTSFTLDFHSNDEKVDSTDTNYERDSYYEITVTFTDLGGTLHTHTFDAAHLGDWNYFDGTTPAMDSGTFTDFDQSAGTIQFSPNNRDVGVWTFDVTHFDHQGLSDTVHLTVNVSNDPAVFDPITLPNWNILEDHEDATTLPYGGTSDSSTYDGSHVTTNDEGYGLDVHAAHRRGRLGDHDGS